MTAEKPAPFHHKLRVETLKLRSTPVEIVADEAQRRAIASVLDIASLESLKAHYDLSRNGEKVQARGTITAELHQTCIVTLDPFPVQLKVPMALDFAPEAEIAPPRSGDSGDEIDIEVALNEQDPPEPIVDGVIDLGTVTVEFLSLALDPYPRKPGAAFEAGPEETPLSPFAALAKLKAQP